jgi:signal transduction histidine kinase
MDKLKSKFFTDISHEFRTPLALIKGPLQQIRKKLSSPADQRLAELAEKHADKLLEMVNQILDLYKIESNNVTLQPVITDLLVLSKGLFFSFESLAFAKEIVLTFESKEVSIPMDLDIQKMETILTNLISNAIKYTNNGGEISLSVERVSDEVILTLKDTGIGISQNDLEKVFDRFFQKSDDSTSFGIGLALTK